MFRNLAQMTPHLAMSFEAAVAPGGAAPAAPATPAPAPAAPAPAAPAPTAAAPAPTKSGYFGGLKRAAVVEPPKPAEPAKEAPAVPPVVPPVAEVVPASAKVEPAPAAAPAIPEALIRPFLGRVDIKTQADAERIYLSSQKEALRLVEEVKTRDAKILDVEAKMAGLQKEFELARKTPALPELTEEQLVVMRKENPYEAIKYEKARDERDARLRSERETAEKSVREARDFELKAAQEAVKTWQAMESDPKAYPKFNDPDVQNRINVIYERSKVNGKSPFDSNPNAPKMLHLMAMGELYVALQQKGVETQADAAEAARAKAAADAAAAVPPNPGGDGGAKDTRTAQQKADDEWRKTMRATGSESPGARIFKQRGT